MMYKVFFCLPLSSLLSVPACFSECVCMCVFQLVFNRTVERCSCSVELLPFLWADSEAVLIGFVYVCVCEHARDVGRP